MPTSTLAHLSLLATALAPAPREALEDPVPSLLEAHAVVAYAADRDGDGTVDADEWSDFSAALVPLLDSEADLIAALIAPVFDLDRDGAFTQADLEAWLARLDADASGSFERSDVDALLARRRRGGSDGLIALVLLRLLDANADDRIEPAEVAAATSAFASRTEDGAGAAALGQAVLAEWIASARARPSERGALTAGVLLLGLPTALDATGDGALTRDDLERLFTTLDTNSDGALQRAEWTPAAGPGIRSGEAWTLPSAAERARPPLVPWQRNLDDALALSQATGRPLLICINMDGELASEALAHRYYKDPAFVARMAGFVPLLVSPDRHTVRDRDGRGGRIADPRFGRLVESEHIDNDALVFERFLGGERFAPRHAGIAPDGTKLFDLFLSLSVAALEARLDEHGVFDAPPVEPRLTELGALLASPAAAHRAEVERRFVASAPDEQVELVRQAHAPERQTAHTELVWLALASPHDAVRQAGALEVAEVVDRVPPALVSRALAEPDARARVLAAIAESGVESPALARLHAAYTGLAMPSALVAKESWSAALVWAPTAAPTADDGDAIGRELTALERRLRADPQDTEVALAFAVMLTKLGDLDAAAGRNPMFIYQDARAAALEVAASVPAERDPRPLAVAAWTAYQLSDFESATDAVERALPHLAPWAGTPLAARTLALCADLRLRALYERIGTDQSFPPEWVADFLACHALLREHPLDVAADVVTWVDALETLQLAADPWLVLERALTRFPDAVELHQRARTVAVREGGADALAALYDRLPPPAGEEAAFAWYRGLALFLAAERAVENGPRWRSEARTWYEASIASFEEALGQEPSFANSGLHYVALAHAGLARLSLAEDDLARATEHANAALEARPETAELEDGLGDTPAAIARQVERALEAAARDAANGR